VAGGIEEAQTSNSARVLVTGNPDFYLAKTGTQTWPPVGTFSWPRTNRFVLGTCNESICCAMYPVESSGPGAIRDGFWAGFSQG
jgi:hypothetical protein